MAERATETVATKSFSEVSMRDWYAEIDKKLAAVEAGKLGEETLNRCADHITWCWKWRKITREQMESLAERVIKLWEDKRV